MRTLLSTLSSIFFVVFCCFSFILFSQNNIEEKLVLINKDIIYLKQENNKIKRELPKEVDSLQQAINETKSLLKSIDSKVAEAKNYSTESATKLNEFQDSFNQRFLRHKNIIKTSVIIAAITAFLLFIILIIIRLKTKKENRTLKNLIVLNEKGILYANEKNTILSEKYNDLLVKIEEQSTFISNLSTKFSLKIEDLTKQLKGFNEINNVRISETQKALDDKFTGLIKTAEKSHFEAVEQFNSEIKQIKTELTEKIDKLRDGNDKHINSIENKFLNEIDAIKKMINNKAE